MKRTCDCLASNYERYAVKRTKWKNAPSFYRTGRFLLLYAVKEFQKGGFSGVVTAIYARML